MEKRIHLTEEQLNQIPKDVLITMHLQLTETMNKVAEQNNQLLRQVASLEEKIDILTQRHFGRKTEKASEIDGLQLSFLSDAAEALNEAEYLLDNAEGPSWNLLLKNLSVNVPNGKASVSLICSTWKLSLMNTPSLKKS